MEQEGVVEVTAQNNSQFITRVVTVYTFLITGIIITAITVAILYQMDILVGFAKNHFFITMLVVSLLMTLNTNIFSKMPYNTQKGGKVLCWVLNCVLSGIPLLNVDSGILLKSVVYTTLLVIILSLKSFIIPEKAVEMFLKPLTAIHTLVLACTVYSLVFGSINNTISLIVTSISLHGGFLVYSGLLVCNTQRLCLNAKQSRFDPLSSAFVFYMNVINLYSRVAVFSSIETSVVEKIC